ncbi:MAG: hypothetical protein GXO55_06350 [Chloroflexi bacterium]|nr:hypothetical protein [Chloroflexota bacterium]
MRRYSLFWIIWGGFVLFLLALGIFMALRSNPASEWQYLPDESTPEAVVHNAYVAASRGDLDRFLSYFDPSVWPQKDLITAVHMVGIDASQLSIGRAEVTGDTARVPVEHVWSAGGGLFGVDFYTQREWVRLKRKGDRWYITTSLPFVAVETRWPVAPRFSP